ncbi:unnamed protein product [Pseudo-nitzschia multistriata]|uniref:DNA (cytosine-5-)-methyltransferase n=1 Tax=Pseudo-nitzschia multistriata TaxID=183589 RepID=A0A448Z2Z2_9STRA|nr:unnamed protein product [Pseudo-nitzschia multistriata]
MAGPVSEESHAGRKRKLEAAGPGAGGSLHTGGGSGMDSSSFSSLPAAGTGATAVGAKEAPGEGSFPSPETTVSISYVEFYSGVGGWTMALEEGLGRLRERLSGEGHGSPKDQNNGQGRPVRYELNRLAALDHSDLCTRVFSHNFLDRKSEEQQTQQQQQQQQQQQHPQHHQKPQPSGPKALSIERMSIKQLEEWSADVWVMSPPCQPHTRQHNGGSESCNDAKDLDDPRSRSFLKICEWLEGPPPSGTGRRRRLRDESLPSLILLENVVGFESSGSFRRWRSALGARGYRSAHFHLTPTQVRLPNDRPRYYCVAIRSTAGGSPLASRSLGSYFGEEPGPDEETPEPLPRPRICKSIPELGVVPETTEDSAKAQEEMPPIASFLDDKASDNGSLRVPASVLESKSAWCFDIVSPRDRRSSCFTHSYGRFVRGTGSVLYEDNGDNESDSAGGRAAFRLLPPDQREYSDDWREGLDPTRLRYFSGKELARLFGFSDTFSFPPDTTHKQQWKLMGNSLSVGVASRLVELGLLLAYGGPDPPGDGPP